MKKLTRIVAALLVLMLAISGAALAEEKKSYKIGLCLSEMTNAIFADMQKRLDELCKTQGNELLVRDAHTDANTLVQAIEDFTSAGCDVIIVQNFAGEAASFALQTARDAGIVICSWDYEIAQAHYNMVVENYDLGKMIGKMAGEWINENHGGKAQVAICGYPALSFLVERENGMRDGLLETAPESEIVISLTAGYANEGFTAGENFLQAYPDVKVVMGINDGGVVGAYNAFKAAGKSKADGIAMFGCDASIDALDAMREEDMYVGTVSLKVVDVCQHLYELGLGAAMTGEKPETSEFVRPTMYPIYLANIDEA